MQQHTIYVSEASVNATRYYLGKIRQEATVTCFQNGKIESTFVSSLFLDLTEVPESPFPPINFHPTEKIATN